MTRKLEDLKSYVGKRRSIIHFSSDRKRKCSQAELQNPSDLCKLHVNSIMRDSVKAEMVDFAREKWPMLFSRFFQVVKFSGRSLLAQDVSLVLCL